MSQLPPKPSLRHLRLQAKDLLKAHRRDGKPMQLSEAQFAVARDYGFSSWPAMVAYVRLVEEYGSYPRDEEARPGLSVEEEFLLLACLTYGVDHPSRREKARALLTREPGVRDASIYAAAVLGDVAEVRRWLERDPALARRRGGPCRWEPLLYVAYSRVALPGADAVETARLLLAHRADPNAGFLWEGFSSPFTVLTGVFGEGEAGPVNQPRHPQEEALARVLLEAGADPNDGQVLYNRQFTRGTTHLELLFEYGLGRPGAGPWPGRLGEKARDPGAMVRDQLFWAAEYDHPERIALLARHGVDCNARSRRKVAGQWREQSVYEVALMSGHAGAAALLLRLGARRVELPPLELLEAACARGDLGAARALATPELLERLGEPLQGRMMVEAARQGRVEAVRCMASLGFPLAPAGESATPLHHAAWFGNRELVELLLALGADVTLRDRTHNATPADWALFNHHPDVAMLLNGGDGLRPSPAGDGEAVSPNDE